MTATIHHLPIPRHDNATTGALAVHNGRLYTKGGPGWICIKGSPFGPDYVRWLEELPADAVTIREGL